ncbi:MAG: TonB-dependent receptor domain-containing protein [Muribaculaceae bacterium]
MFKTTVVQFLRFSLLAAFLIPNLAYAETLGGVVTDATDSQPIIGAAVSVVGTKYATVTDIDGNYELSLPRGEYSVEVKYLGYDDMLKQITIEGNANMTVDFALKPSRQSLNEVTVTTAARRNSEVTQIHAQRSSLVVQSGVSAQLIARTQDKDASEVIRRVPGISVIDEKFVMVRGLSQRYNNVWLNGGAVPSSEADTRAFSFDIIPGAQLDNIVVVKSPAPEYPADFSGGFILVNTKQLPSQRGFNISLGLGVNDHTHFKDFIHSRGSSTDWLGFDGGLRHLDAGMTVPLKAYPGYETGANPRIDVLGNSLNNDWTLRSSTPWGDIKFNACYNDTWHIAGDAKLGLIAALLYNNTYRTVLGMTNSLYGPYDVTNGKSVTLRSATDDSYSHEARLGAMLNMSLFCRDRRHTIEWKNIFNQIGKDKYSERVGYNAQPDNINDMEYYYTSRSTYNTQFTGKHIFDADRIDWSLAYSYANREMPDRRLIQRTDRTEQTMGIYRISREFSHLAEHIASLSANYKRDLTIGSLTPTIKAGIYGEYRTRSYRTRQLQYGWQPDNTLPAGFMFFDDVPNTVLIDENYGPDKLYIYEEVNYLNNYNAKSGQMAGYVGLNVPYRAFDFYVGARYEFMRQILSLNTLQYQESLHDTNYDYSDIYPSANITYHIIDGHQLRAAYGRSVNRPEFRELSPSVFYDFDLGSDVMGNYDLKAAYIDNVDLRYEWYPSDGEQVSLALFYKHFTNPIEWTYTVAGGTDLIYSFVNARGANNYGIEIDIRKNLAFIGLPDFSLSLNGSLIKSKVRFDAGSNNIDRPMQGQSPYLINCGLFYNNKDYGWDVAALYNRIGRRIIGVGNRYGTADDGTARNIPNSYEMPRNVIDLSVSKRFGKWQVKAAVRDLLAEKVTFMQFEDITAADGKVTTVQQLSRSFNPGRSFSITVAYDL